MLGYRNFFYRPPPSPKQWQAAKLSTLQRKLAESQLRCANLEAEAERGLAAEAAAAPSLACGLREENAALRVRQRPTAAAAAW